MKIFNLKSDLNLLLWSVVLGFIFNAAVLFVTMQSVGYPLHCDSCYRMPQQSGGLPFEIFFFGWFNGSQNFYNILIQAFSSWIFWIDAFCWAAAFLIVLGIVQQFIIKKPTPAIK